MRGHIRGAVARTLRKEIKVFKKNQSCTDCGCHKPDQMEFDHLPERGAKLFNVGAAGFTVWTDLQSLREEISKCQLVCSSCHRRREAVRYEQAQSAVQAFHLLATLSGGPTHLYPKFYHKLNRSFRLMRILAGGLA